MKSFICLVALVAVEIVHAQGNIEAMLGYVGSTSTTISAISADVNGPVGWTFQPVTDISVTALGAWAYAMPGSGRLIVGLWDASGTLLASNTVTTAHSSPVNQSLYESITPVTLTAGQTYYLAAYSPAGFFQSIAVNPNDPPNGFATMNSDILLGNVAYKTNSGFAFPDTTENLPGSAIVAPNFEFQAVPEPSILAVSGAGAIALLAWRRRR